MADTPVTIDATSFCAWNYNTSRAGPPTPPVYPDQQLDPGTVSFFPYPVRDPNNLPLTFSLVTPLPASLQINPSTGEIYGTLTALDWSRATCQVQVSNGSFSVTGPTFRLYTYAVGGVETRATIYGIEYAVHTFTVDSFGQSGQVTVPFTVSRNIAYAEYLVVAGGGGGGSYIGGGGGGGGVRIGTTAFGIGSFTASIGNGGAAATNGYDSSLGSIIALGGGYGGTSGSQGQGSNGIRAGTGGSGGGGGVTYMAWSGVNYVVNNHLGSAGTAGQGNTGGDGSPGNSGTNPLDTVYTQRGGGGGGGAGAAGSVGVVQAGGNGGSGIGLVFTGTLTYYAGGGGGSTIGYTQGAGGLGGGGSVASASVNGTAGTGGGGAGANGSTGGRGGSGIVIVRYPLYPEPAGVKRFGLVQWLDAQDYTSGAILWDDRTANYDIAMLNSPVKDSVDGGGCIVFNGTTNLGTYNTPNELAPITSYSVELWAKWTTTGTTSSTIQTILDNSSTIAAPSFVLQDRPDLGKALAFEYQQSSGGTVLLSGAPVGDGNWHHIVVSCDFNTPAVQLYVDGTLSNSVPTPSQTNRVIKAASVIGRWDSGSSRYFAGRLAVFRTYGRALSSDDVVNNFLTEASRFGVAPFSGYGGTMTTIVVGNTAYRAHIFSASALDGITTGTLTVLAPIASAEYLILGGGGGGGTEGGGGGGAGGMLTGTRAFAVGSFAANVGAGGAGASSGIVRGTSGFDSTLDATSALGGGGGASRLDGLDAAVGGSGGGGGGQVSGTRYLGAAGTVGQGSAGGNGTGPSDAGSNAAGGGGGGAGAVGTAAASAVAGAGGIGAVSSITGLRILYAGGGGGGIFFNGTIGSGGRGGGGAGSASAGSDGTNTTGGGGGGGGGGSSGGRGGSGAIVVRYPTGSVSPVVDANQANALVLLPGLGWVNSSVSNMQDFATTTAMYAPTSTAAFDGTGDYLSTPTSANFTFGTGDFTLEGWFYATGSLRLLYDLRPLSTSGNYPTVYFDSSNRVSYYYASADRLLSPVLSQNTWYHFAVSRVAGSRTILFVNGEPVGILPETTTVNFLSGPTVGLGMYSFSPSTNANNWSGNLSNFRVTKGVARYLPTYTQPAAAFPDSVAGGDLYFAKVILLLHGNGANGSTTFTDSSNNALVPTPVGNVQISTAQSKFGGSSILFDGSGDGLSYATNSLFNLGADDFTIEAWVYLAGNSPLSASNTRHAAICASQGASGSTTALQLLVLGNSTTTGTGLQFDNIVSGSQTSITYTGTIAQGVWHHVAVSRRGTLTRLFLDGACVAVGTLGNQSIANPNALTVGRSVYTGYPYDFNGYIDDFRFSRVARYTANFTPPQSYPTGGADPNFANVSLLLPFDEPIGSTTFSDVSNNAVAITTTGDTVAAARSIGTWQTASPKNYGGAVYFNGTATEGFIRTLPTNTFFADGDFTMETWFRTDLVTAAYRPLIVGGDYNTAGRSSIGIWNYGTEIRVNRSVLGTAAVLLSSSTVAANTWIHVALMRVSKVLYLFVNYTAVAAVTDSTNYYDMFFNGARSLGGPGDATVYSLTGYLQDTRIYNVAKYAVSDPYFGLNTLLLHCEGTNGSTTFTDSSLSNATVTANGNAVISTIRSKFGTASALFDGTGDYLSWAGTSFAATDDFTVEAWVYKTAVDASGYTVLFYGASNQQFAFDNTTAGSISLVLNNAAVIAASGTAVTPNVWHHLAWTRQGTTCRAFVDGVLMGTGTSSAAFSISEIGRYGVSPFGYEMNGSLDEIRITKGYARYTGTFTPPVAAFADRPSFDVPTPMVK